MQITNPTPKSLTPLDYAPREIWYEIASYMDHRTGQGMLLASKVFKQIAEKGLNPTTNNHEWIRKASELGHLRVVQFLLNRKEVDPSVNDNLAIRRASRNGHVEVVKELLKDPRVKLPVTNAI